MEINNGARRREISPFIVGTAGKLFSYKPDSCGSIAYTDKKEAYHILDEIWEMGLRSFDCAANYGEIELGEYLKVRNRINKAVIVTKGCHPSQFRNRVTPYDLMSDVHDSLVKLHRDFIDIYLLHRDDPAVPVEEIVTALDKLHREGKIGVYGGSNWTVERIKEANKFAGENGMQPFTVSSPNYSLAHQVADPWGGGCTTLTGPEHAEDRAWYLEQQMPILAYSALGRGFFAGAFKSDEYEKADEVMDCYGRKGYVCKENFNRLARAEQMAKKYRCSVAQIALAWIFSQKLNVIPVLGGGSIGRFAEGLEAVKIKLTEEEIDWLNLRKEKL